MSRIRFEDLPSTNTPITAENLDKLNNVVISPTEPTTGEEVWIKKGKNKFNANELFLDQTNHVTNNNSTNKLSITTNGNYGYSRYKLTIPNEYLNKEVSISFNGVSTINKSQNNIRNTIYISSTPDESGDIMTQLLTTTKTKYSIKFTPNSQEIYITLYGTLSDYSTIMTIEMSEIQLELGEPTEYEEYIEKEIYVKNENGVFERFYREDEDSGVLKLTETGESYAYIKYRKVGKMVQVNSPWYSETGINIPAYEKVLLGTLPQGYKPTNELNIPIYSKDKNNITSTNCLVSIGTDGKIKIVNASSTDANNIVAINFNTMYIVNE